MRKLLAIIFYIILSSASVSGQELQARITVISNQINSTIDKKVFQTLQGALSNFINNRKWTSDDFQSNEKVQCNFLLTLTKELGDNTYQAILTIQAARPIFNSTYQSPIINFQDENIVFRYVEFQPIEFNENRVQGNDPVASNLTAILAYYIYIVLGFDYDSFTLRGGDAYFEKAWNIVTNAPEGKSITGWKPFDGVRNRYYLAESLRNNQFALIHDAIYSYYRSGFDVFFENEDDARSALLNALNLLNIVNASNPNSMLLQFFFQGKSNELVKAFSKAEPGMKNRAREILLRLDVTNTAIYRGL